MGSTEDGHAQTGSTPSPRNHRNRASGGFLLESPSGPTSFVRSLLANSKQGSKGKWKSDGIETPARTRKSQVEDVNEERVKSSLIPKESQFGVGSAGSSSATPVSLSRSTGSSVQRDGRPISSSTGQGSLAGFDDDPARIVDMALRLSEGRRRQASDKRHVSTDVSTRNAPHDREGDAIQNQKKLHVVGQSLAQSPVQGAKDLSKSHAVGRHPLKGTQQHVPSDSATEDHFIVSRATAKRVDKAKIYMELAYEHRRLLSHLPPVHRPNTQPRQGTTLAESKLYNPLQYARNRKLRLREKNGLTPEADGWHDVAKVKSWVDAAIDSHAETQHDPTECVRLPPFYRHDEDLDKARHNLPNSPQAKQNTRPRRPKSDWILHPGDLLADAYWLEQGLNKTKIQDRNNQTIYPPDTQFKYAGWGTRATSIHVPDSMQQSTPPPLEKFEIKPTKTSPLSEAPKLPNFRSAHEKQNNSRRLRGPKRLKDSLVNEAKDSTRRALEMFDKTSDSDESSDSASSGSDSDDDNHRGRKRGLSQAFKFNLVDGDPFSSPMSSDRQVNGVPEPESANSHVHSEGGPTKALHETSPTIQSSHKKGTNQTSTSGNERSGKRKSLFDKRDRSRERSRSSGDNDTLSPASPINYGLPSIAINLSPTGSRSSSPSKKSHKIFGSLREKHRSKDKEQVEAFDFVKDTPKSHSRDPSTDADRSRNGSGNDSRGTSPFNKTRRDSSTYEIRDAYQSHRDSTISRTSTKSISASNDHHSRIRGMFKGGRIAEIVGTEVTKVGDYIWKRDPPTERVPTSVSEISAHSRQSSDTEGENVGNGHPFKTPPRNTGRSMSSSSSHTDLRSSLDKSEDKTQYHNPNLPSFTSPFQRDREKMDKQRDATTPGSSGRRGDDHISLQVEEHRTRSRSPRLDRLAPPRLDTSGSAHDRKGSYGFGGSLDLTKSRSASQAYNEAIDDSKGAHSTARMTQNKTTASNKPRIVSKNDLSRIESLLLISTAKANAIMCAQRRGPVRENNIVINRAVSQFNGPSRSDEHVRAARELIAKLSEYSNQFNEKLHNFSSTTVSNLHSELQLLEDNIENALVPRVRVAADQAGELSMKLTTTSTLAVKGLNDTIVEAARLRKRGPFRWVRSLGYGAIEWGVVSLLWIIWAVVTIIQIFLGTIRTGTRFVRWMLWVD